MQAAAAQSHIYPDNDADELRQKLAEHHSLSPDQIAVGAGLTDLIGVLSRALLKPGLNAITSERSFIVYGIAVREAGGILIETGMRDGNFDLDAIGASINSHTRAVFLANPNNPTGSLFDGSTTDQFLTRVPDDVTVVLDEAYYEYAQHFAALRGVHYSHSPDYVRAGRNLIVLRTFSKAHGLAGVRIGYAMGRPELIRAIATRRNTYSVSRPAQAAALAAMQDGEHIRRAVESNAVEETFLSHELLQLGYRVLPTWANFLYCDLGMDADEVEQLLKNEGVIIRSLARWGAAKAIRITIGTREQNAAFVAAFKKVRSSR
jgi:histidinol-phosphate aminotransferase